MYLEGFQVSLNLFPQNKTLRPIWIDSFAYQITKKFDIRKNTSYAVRGWGGGQNMSATIRFFLTPSLTIWLIKGRLIVSRCTGTVSGGAGTSAAASRASGYPTWCVGRTSERSSNGPVQTSTTTQVQGNSQKKVREMSSQLFVTLFTLYIYPPEHKQLRRHLPNPFCV